MKILEVSNYFPEHAGGIEYVTLNLVRRWQEHHQVRWMACDVNAHPHIAAINDVPLPACNFAEERLGFPYPIPVGDSFLRIFREVRDCDVVHLHDCLYLANIITFVASLWYHKPLLVTQHIGPVPYAEAYKNLLQYIAYASLGRLVLQHAQRVVFINERVKTWFEARMKFRSKPLLIPNGVDTSLFHPPTTEERNTIRASIAIPPATITILFVGRFTQKKGLHIIRKLAAEHPAWMWMMIGQGEINPQEWQLPNLRIIPPVPQAELQQYYAVADLLILPSVGEGLPLALQEALACGLPVAISAETSNHIPDAPLICLDIEALPRMNQALNNLFEQKNHLANLRKDGAEYARRWDWDGTAKAYEKILLELFQQGAA